MKERKKYLLAVINQDVEVKKLVKSISLNSNKNVIILSTHKFFSTEEDQLRKKLNTKKVIFINFGQFLDDSSMLEFDKLTFESLDINVGNHWESLTMSKEKMLFLRNEFIYNELVKTYLFTKIVYFATLVETFNLGVSHTFWKAKGANRLVPNLSYHFWKRALFQFKRISILKKVGVSILGLYKQFSSRVFYKVYFDDEIYFFHSLHRLHFDDEVKIEELNFKPIKFISITGSNDKDTMFMRFVASLELNEELPLKWATPLHQYQRMRDFVQSPPKELYIFEDAYRPSNYPIYYYAKMFYLGKVVVRDMFDFEYFKKSGKEVIKPYGPLKISYFQTEKMRNEATGKPKTIVLSINHTGDWTFLINRSDTDVIIEKFALLAKEHESLTFIIRPHPTMLNPIAEGINSIERIRKFVDQLSLTNLTVSSVSLEKDWERGDIFISEYSLSVLDAMRIGKLGFFMNPTSRRSFVQDFIDLGFPHTNSYEDMSLMLKSMLEDPDMHRENIIKASLKYNDCLNDFLTKHTP